MSSSPNYPCTRKEMHFSLKEIFAKVKEDSPTETRRFSVYSINHEDSIMCPFLLAYKEHRDLIISNLKGS